MGRRLFAALVLGSMALAPAAASANEAAPRERQWGLEQVRAPETWARTQGKGTVVAVVDTGVDLQHPDLAPRLLRDDDGEVVGVDIVDGGPPQDEHGHGTQVAGIVAAAGEEPGDLTGVAPEAMIMPVRVLDDQAAGSRSDVDEGIRWAVDNGADVINLSLEAAVPLPGEIVTSGPDEAVRYAWERGVVVVAASGNSATPFSDYPSSSPVVMVGATDRNDRRAVFSEGARSDMLMAPGVGIISSWCRPCGEDSQAQHREDSGTSFAAPHVAGALALLLAHGWGPERALEALRETAVDVPGAAGPGRIDVAEALGVESGNGNGDGDRNGDGSDTEGSRDGDAGGEGREQETASAEPSDDPSSSGSAPSDEAADREPEPEPEPDPEPDEEPQPPEPEDEPDVRPEPPPGSQGSAEVDDDADTVALPADGRRPRIGLLEGAAAGLVGLSATAVGVARKRWPAG
jgi:subtilisin family serine protease